MKNLLEFIVKSIVETPEQVTIQEQELVEGKKYLIQVPQEQIGIVVGRKGRTIKAIRNLLAVGSRGERFFIEVNQTDKEDQL